MPDKKPTGTRSEVDRHLDRADRLLAERRGEKFDDPEEITSREQVEEIAKQAAEDAVRGTPVQFIPVVFPERPVSSSPPSAKTRNAKWGAIGGALAGLAAVLTALSQCSHDVRDVKHPPVPAMVREAK